MRERKVRGNHAERVVRARGWAVYVRTAVEDAGRAERQRRQAVALARRRSSGARGPRVRAYRDIGSSGRDLRRPGLERLLADAEAGRFGGVAVTDPARLARDAAQLCDVLGRLEALGVEVALAGAAPRFAESDR